jgi:hypothetical protein
MAATADAALNPVERVHNFLYPGGLEPLREPKITCAEVLNARDREVIIRIKVNNGVSTGHLDIQVAKVVDVIRRQSREVDPISPAFKIGRVMPFWAPKTNVSAPPSPNMLSFPIPLVSVSSPSPPSSTFPDPPNTVS